MNIQKAVELGIFGVAASFFSTLYGGWSEGMTVLVLFMIVDYLTGLAVAGVFKRSTKTNTGALESRAGWKGLLRKGVTLLVVLVAAQLDKVTGVGFIRDAVVFAYIANEAISIVENAGLMGIPVPAVIRKGIEILNKKGDSQDV